MIGMTTGRYSVLRGSSTNEYGDEIDSQTVASSGHLGSVIEKSRQVFNPVDGKVATVRALVGRFNFNVDIEDGDRIKNEKTGEIYVVSAKAHGSNAVFKSSVELELTLV